MHQTGLDSLLERKVPDCRDVSINAGMMIARTMASGEPDSTAQVLEHWRRKCPHSESGFRTEVLLRLNNDSSVRDMINADAFGALWNYQWLASFPREVLTADAPHFVQYADFTRKWAQDLLPK